MIELANAGGKRPRPGKGGNRGVGKGKAERDGWFNPHDRVGKGLISPRTLMSHMAHEVVPRFREFIRNPENMTALEIGPGVNPLANRLPFKSVTYLEGDSERSGLRGQKARIRRGESPEKPRFVVGLMQRPPFNNVFGVCIVNEVFTHIRPKRRIAALRKAMKISNNIFIIDRFGSSHPHSLKETLVDPMPLLDELDRHGFQTDMVVFPQVDFSLDKYFIIMAKRTA